MSGTTTDQTVQQAPSMFDRSLVVPMFRNVRLSGLLGTYLAGLTISDDEIWWKIRAEEKLAEARWRTFLHPRQMYPQYFDPALLATMNTANYPVMEEPGYDYEPEMFQGDSWGDIQLRRTHVVQIQRIQFCYPNPEQQLYVIPADWIRYDRKYGRVNLVATTTPTAIPLNVFIMGALSGGRRIPLMMQVVYQAGLVNAFENDPDIVDYILKCAALSLIEDQFVPQSGSVSIDGMSQSTSFETGKMRDQLDRRADTIESRLNGIRVGFC